jgi:hypothetical protein
MLDIPGSKRLASEPKSGAILGYLFISATLKQETTSDDAIDTYGFQAWHGICVLMYLTIHLDVGIGLGVGREKERNDGGTCWPGAQYE